MWQIDEFMTGEKVDDIVDRHCNVCDTIVNALPLDAHACVQRLVG